jgi:hypothetical protein
MNSKLSRTLPPALEFDWEVLNNKTLMIRVQSSIEDDWKTTVVMAFDTKTNHAYVIANKQERIKR